MSLDSLDIGSRVGIETGRNGFRLFGRVVPSIGPRNVACCSFARPHRERLAEYLGSQALARLDVSHLQKSFCVSHAQPAVLNIGLNRSAEVQETNMV